MADEKSRLEAGDGGGEIFWRDFRGNSTAVIFRSLFVDNKNRLYSSMRLTSSSSQVIVTSTSRSSVGNLHFKVIEDPHSSKNLTISSVTIIQNSLQFIGNSIERYKHTTDVCVYIYISVN